MVGGDGSERGVGVTAGGGGVVGGRGDSQWPVGVVAGGGGGRWGWWPVGVVAGGGGGRWGWWPVGVVAGGGGDSPTVSSSSCCCSVIDALYVRNTLAVRSSINDCRCLFKMAVCRQTPSVYLL